MNENNNIEKIKEKIENEYTEYINELKIKDIDNIINSSYETSIKELIYDYFCTEDCLLNGDDIDCLIKYPGNLLNALSSEFFYNSDELNDPVSNSVFNFIDSLDCRYYRNTDKNLYAIRNEDIGDDGVFRVPEGIEYIEESTFMFNNNLKKVILPSSLIEIKHHAFFNCKNLETVIFENNNSLLSIDESAFAGCNKLKELSIPDSIEHIYPNILVDTINCHVNLPSKFIMLNNRCIYLKARLMYEDMESEFNTCVRSYQDNCMSSMSINNIVNISTEIFIKNSIKSFFYKYLFSGEWDKTKEKLYMKGIITVFNTIYDEIIKGIDNNCNIYNSIEKIMNTI